MNHIITGDERNVKNLETKVYMVYISWGMFFKDGLISLQKQIRSIHCYPPVTEVKQRADNQNGEFEATHCRKANLKRHIAARLPKGRIKRFRINQLYIYLTLITSTFSCFCSEETSKGCAVRHSPYIVVTLISNIQKGEFEATRRRHGKAPCTLGGGTRGFPLGYNSEAI